MTLTLLLKTQCLQRQMDCNTDYFSETTGIPAAKHYANQNIKKIKKKSLPVYLSISSNCVKYLIDGAEVTQHYSESFRK